MNLTQLREAVAAALDTVGPVDGDVVEVHPQPVDAVTPPALIVVWGPDPWRYTETVCMDWAQLEVIVVAGRLTPEGGYPLLEQLVDQTVAALVAARFRPAQMLAPAPFEIGQVTYLAARLQLRHPVTTTGGT